MVGDANFYRLIAAVASDRREHACWIEPDRAVLSWAALDAATARHAAALRASGVVPGDRVLAQVEKSTTALLLYLGCLRAGAVFVPLNTAYRGAVLEHVVNAAGAAVMVAHHSLVERLDGLALAHLRQVIAVGGTPSAVLRGLELLPAEALHGDAATLDDSAEVDLWDIQSIIYTSGTTGASKGVLSPYLQLWTTAMVN